LLDDLAHAILTTFNCFDQTRFLAGVSLQRVQQLFLPSPDWKPAYMKTAVQKTTNSDAPAVANGDTSHYAKRNGFDNENTHNDNDAHEMTSAKTQNGGIHVDSINPAFIDDEMQESRSDGEGLSRAAAANGSIKSENENDVWSVANNNAYVDNEAMSSDDFDDHLPSTDQNDHYEGVAF
jgi:hypothetical protein